ncbi:serine hydrolase domain-containing protein [Kribbella sp. CA-253562]|uniref:serine hydrolase domain-containing protein n=1 Tax=Kribbella sp. CA-253562 TaxID=3239942 RepID=UPI003D8F0B70
MSLSVPTASVLSVTNLPRSTPEAQGLSSAGLDGFVATLDASGQEIQTMMLVRHGHVVLEREWSPYRLSDRHLLFSVSKSFTSMGVGLAVEAGLLSVDDKVVSFFSGDDLPDKISDNLAAMEVRHLLTMSTGHDVDTVDRLGRTGRMVQGFLRLDVENAPGAPFVYNSGATYMLSAIVQKVTGEKLIDYLRPRLFEPLGATEAIWETSDEGINMGGWGLSLNTHSLANFGQLLLQRGVWNGEQLVPAEWIDAATSAQVDNSVEPNPDWQQGYGYQFWRGRHNTYRGDGAFGQYCLVLPDHDTALIITSATADMQATLDLVWERLLPVLEESSGAAGSTGGVDGASAGDGIAAGTGELKLPPPAGPPPAPGDGRTYTFPANDTGLSAIRWDADGSGTFTFAAARPWETGSQEIAFAPGDWNEQTYTLTDPVQRIVTSAHGDGETYVATMRLLETPFVVTLRCRPTGDRLTVDVSYNVGFGKSDHTVVSE